MDPSQGDLNQRDARSSVNSIVTLLALPSVQNLTEELQTQNSRLDSERTRMQNNSVTGEATPSAEDQFISMSSGEGSSANVGTANENPMALTSPSAQHPPPPFQSDVNGNLGISLPYAPPDWEKLYIKTLASHNNLTWSRYSVDEEDCADEFQTIADLLKPFKVLGINKIVNPELWNSYQTQRVSMLKKNSENVDVLLELGMNAIDADTRVRRANNFQKDPLLRNEDGSYSSNEALLFHCSRSFTNVDNVLDEGLDERLGSNLILHFGKGLYFSDDPIKADEYANNTGIIIIFAVLLGDCKDMGIGGGAQASNMQREPKKKTTEMRNPDDKFFDSITARLSGSPHNEYVIYNRNQCYPLYEVEYRCKYKNTSRKEYVPECYFTARRTTPSIAWQPAHHATTEPSSSVSQNYMPNQHQSPVWPFLIPMIFNKMGLVDMKMSLKRFKELGFPDSTQATQVLLKFDHQFDVALKFLQKQRDGRRDSDSEEHEEDYDGEEEVSSAIEETQDDLLDDPSSPPLKKKMKTTKKRNRKIIATRTTSTQTYPSLSTRTDTSTAPLEMECQVCAETITTVSQSTWITLRCRHSMCANCLVKIQKTGTTMSKETHTSIICPFCKDVDGVVIGDCPDGIMLRSAIQTSCSGYPEFRSIVLIYSINCIKDGEHYEILKQAYLPANEKGKKIAKLLKVAWDRRLIFSIEENPSPEESNTLYWNIQHKTSPTSNGARGFPDPTYLDRVLETLASYGIYE